VQLPCVACVIFFFHLQNQHQMRPSNLLRNGSTAAPYVFQPYRRMVVRQMGLDFRTCTAIETVDQPPVLRPTEILVRTRWAAINASDVNLIAGKYGQLAKVGSGCGLEAIGEVVAVGGSDASSASPSPPAAAQPGSDLQVGDCVVTQFSTGAFSEYQVAAKRAVRKVPRCDPAVLSLEISGITASIALQLVGQPVEGETALVTAAAGGTGSYAVQLLKHVYKCRTVVGTCGSDSKAAYLKRLGCDVVINRREGPIGPALQAVTKGGFGVIYESVGGEMLRAALDNVGLRGRIVTIGGVSSYLEDAPWTPTDCDVSKMLLSKSASLRAFFLPHFKKYQQEHFDRLLHLVDTGVIVPCVDTTRSFKGLEQIPDAMDHLLAGGNCGKVVVEL
jgi:NADPH-dependent curcumin reductase CurA